MCVLFIALLSHMLASTNRLSYKALQRGETGFHFRSVKDSHLPLLHIDTKARACSRRPIIYSLLAKFLLAVKQMLSMLSDELSGSETEQSLLEATLRKAIYANSSSESLSTRPAHLSLTDYGPESATQYLRENLQILSQFSCIYGSSSSLHQPHFRPQSHRRSRNKRFRDSAGKQGANRSQELRHIVRKVSVENKQDIQKSPKATAPRFDSFPSQIHTDPVPNTDHSRHRSSSHQDYVPEEDDNDIYEFVPVGSENNFRFRHLGPHVQSASWIDSDSENDHIDHNEVVSDIFDSPLSNKLDRSSSEFAGYSKMKRKGGRSGGVDLEDTWGEDAGLGNCSPSTSFIRRSDSRSPVQDKSKGKGKASASMHNQGRAELSEAAECLWSEPHGQETQENYVAAEYEDNTRLPPPWDQDHGKGKAPLYERSYDRTPDQNRAGPSSKIARSAFHDPGTSLNVGPSEIQSATISDVMSPDDREHELSRLYSKSTYSSRDLTASSILETLKAQRTATMAGMLDEHSSDSLLTSGGRLESLGNTTSRPSSSPLERSTQSESKRVSKLRSRRKSNRSGNSCKKAARKTTSLQDNVLKLKPSAIDQSEVGQVSSTVQYLINSEINDPFPELNFSQRQSVRPIDYEHLIFGATGDVEDAESSNQIEFGSSLSDRSRCIHQNPDGSNTPHAHMRSADRGWLPDVPQDILLEIVKFISFEDLKNLRLVNKTFAGQLFDTQFQSVVFRFGPEMFKDRSVESDSPLQDKSIFEVLGKKIQKFGIAFEIDLTDGLYYAQQKKNVSTEDAFWGSYKWPGLAYPRFRQLHNLEELADNIKYLKTAMSCLTDASELGLSLDTGHGWLAGADQSDMAIYESRSKKSPIFKRRFAMNRNHSLVEGILFESAQMKTYQCIAKGMGLKEEEWRKLLRSYPPIRSLSWFKDEDEEDEECRDARHAGNLLSILKSRDSYSELRRDLSIANQPQPIPGLFIRHAANAFVYPTNPPASNVPRLQSHIRQALTNDTTIDAAMRQSPQGREVGRRSFNFPLIFNGVNLQKGVGGGSNGVKDEVHSPDIFPLKPNKLTEPQAQWLIETAWAQRAFLASYVTAVVSNKAILGPNIHSLHITKISSGLLHNLADKEFWTALPKLQTVTLLVIPDWRRETHPIEETSDGPKAFITPYTASLHFKDFLDAYIAPLENVSKLTIGFASGGEHATGMLARNNHVLPAPLTSDPKNWLVTRENGASPDPNAPTMISFEHVTSLTVYNAWITPHMLRTFMQSHHDTSLKTLVLDSVSLTTQHSLRTTFIHVGPGEVGSEPQYGPAAWLHETLPTRDCWPALLDDITPGQTFEQQKLAAGMISAEEASEPSFRGNIDCIELKSCGYVQIIGGVKDEEYGQTSLVLPSDDPMDPCLTQLRRELGSHAMVSVDSLYADMVAAAHATLGIGNRNQQQNNNNHQHAVNATAGAARPRQQQTMVRDLAILLGKITSAIHPKEKRVLEMGFGMKFGWGNCLERWGPVVDGCFEGGTGRFSGTITKAGAKGTTE
ncbi:MAG: hypothetical protein Q9160_002676 [Pyrenula sp. 1 TL-2023]